MAPTPLAFTYCSASDLEALLSVDGVTGRVDDDNTGSQSTTEQGYITSAINWATAKVNQYCLARYADSDLATSFVVNEWCIVLACRWLCLRRGNPVPESMQELYEETRAELESIQKNDTMLPDLAGRDVAWPAWSNVRTDFRYSLRRLRVERPISESSTPKAPFKRNRDLFADVVIEPT